MVGLCHSCLEQKEIVENNLCASCTHDGQSRKISPENQEMTPHTIQDLKRKWEIR